MYNDKAIAKDDLEYSVGQLENIFNSFDPDFQIKIWIELAKRMKMNRLTLIEQAKEHIEELEDIIGNREREITILSRGLNE